MDILSAIENARPARGSHLCPLAEWLAGIPEKTEGRDELIRLIETKHDRSGSSDTRSAESMATVLGALGYKITEGPIHAHRKHACRCYR